MANSNSEYNMFPVEYAENVDGGIFEPVEFYTVDHCILGPLLDEQGLLTEKRVLDVACGAGRYTRRLKSLNTAYILGIDISPKMIQAAREIEMKDSKNIDYMVSDVKQLPSPEIPFDLVTGFYLLNYARTQEELLQMVRSIYAQLGENKCFVGLTNNIEGTTASFDKRKYGFISHVNVSLDDGPIPEGTEVFITLLGRENKPECTFTSYYFSHKTHEKVFKEAGFKTLEWIPYQCDPEAPNKEFYNDLVKNASDIGFRATK